ncbi:sigma-54-dependent Fis family transcriptional regulator [Thioalkalivibrio sp.]|uniref:sigma-54-dependent Fis family transcriptional regulator n=1 Tax=Thioalkalivibrio sp. TaxID=2093813 RepID=UPI0035612BC3
MNPDSQLGLIETLIQQNRDGALVIDNHGRIVTHNTALVELLEQPAGTRFETTLRMGPINLQRLLVRAAIAAGEQDAVGRASSRSLDFRTELDTMHPVLPVRITSVPLDPHAGDGRLRLITVRPEPPLDTATPDAAGFMPGSPLESADERCRMRLDLARRAVASGIRVLLVGETGTGKTVLARALHRSGPRAAAACAEMHCASMPETVLDSELFGHTRGAFPGASAERIGRLESADGGTLILDGVDGMSAPLQQALHRVLADGRFERMGENRVRQVDLQVISTSSRDLRHGLASGRFGRGLYHQLAGLIIALAPLRERPGDLDATLECWSRHTDVALTDAARGLLHRHDWPGNFRELRNLLGALGLHAEPGARVDADAVREAFEDCGVAWHPSDAPSPAPFTAAERRERETLQHALTIHNGNRSQAARSLGMDRTTLWRKLHRLRLIPEPERAPD